MVSSSKNTDKESSCWDWSGDGMGDGDGGEFDLTGGEQNGVEAEDAVTERETWLIRGIGADSEAERWDFVSFSEFEQRVIFALGSEDDEEGFLFLGGFVSSDSFFGVARI